MVILPDERKQISRLFNFLLQGEYLARDCSRSQARFFPDQYSRSFLLRQSRQENLHARIFREVIGILSPRGAGPLLGGAPMQRYRRLIEQALRQYDLAGSLLGMQVIMEGVGDVAINSINDGIVTRGLDLKRLRRLVVGQEEAHHDFGVRRLDQLVCQNDGNSLSLQHKAADYLELMDALIGAAVGLFEYFGENANDYVKQLYQKLPPWMYNSATSDRISV